MLQHTWEGPDFLPFVALSVMIFVASGTVFYCATIVKNRINPICFLSFINCIQLWV